MKACNTSNSYYSVSSQFSQLHKCMWSGHYEVDISSPLMNKPVYAQDDVIERPALICPAFWEQLPYYHLHTHTNKQ